MPVLHDTTVRYSFLICRFWRYQCSSSTYADDSHALAIYQGSRVRYKMYSWVMQPGIYARSRWTFNKYLQQTPIVNSPFLMSDLCSALLKKLNEKWLEELYLKSASCCWKCCSFDSRSFLSCSTCFAISLFLRVSWSKIAFCEASSSFDTYSWKSVEVAKKGIALNRNLIAEQCAELSMTTRWLSWFAGLLHNKVMQMIGSQKDMTLCTKFTPCISEFDDRNLLLFN